MDPSVVSLVSVIVSGIVAISGSVVSVVIARNNIKHQERILKRKMYVQRQIDVIEKYLASIGTALDHGTVTPFHETQGTIFLYVPKEYWNDIEALNKMLSTSDRYVPDVAAKSYVLLNKVSQELYDYMKSLRD